MQAGGEHHELLGEDTELALLGLAGEALHTHDITALAVVVQGLEAGQVQLRVPARQRAGGRVVRKRTGGRRVRVSGRRGRRWVGGGWLRVHMQEAVKGVRERAGYPYPSGVRVLQCVRANL